MAAIAPGAARAAGAAGTAAATAFAATGNVLLELGRAEGDLSGLEVNPSALTGAARAVGAPISTHSAVAAVAAGTAPSSVATSALRGTGLVKAPAGPAVATVAAVAGTAPEAASTPGPTLTPNGAVEAERSPCQCHGTAGDEQSATGGVPAGPARPAGAARAPVPTFEAITADATRSARRRRVNSPAAVTAVAAVTAIAPIASVAAEPGGRVAGELDVGQSQSAARLIDAASGRRAASAACPARAAGWPVGTSMSECSKAAGSAGAARAAVAPERVNRISSS